MPLHGDNFSAPVEVEKKIHTDARPFCSIDPDCPCHEDPVLISQVNEYVLNGLLTQAEAVGTIKGEIPQRAEGEQA